MPRDRELEIHQRLDVRTVEIEDALTEIEQAEGGDDSDDAEHGRDPEHEAHVPGFGLVPVAHVVVGDGQDGAVVEQRDHHDHDRGHGIEVEDENRECHEQQHA